MSQARNILVLDLETQKSFKEVGKARLEKLHISCVGIYDYLDDSYRCYEEKEVMGLEKRIREADLIIGFNIRRFDMPVLAPYLFVPVQELPVLDLLEDIEKARGHRASLESVSSATLKQHKSGSGADALTLFREGKMEELKKYCLDDVRLTRAVYEFGCREGKIFFTSSWDYKTYEIPVSWKEQTSSFTSKEAVAPEAFPASLF